jgi:hypothetical protein
MDAAGLLYCVAAMTSEERACLAALLIPPAGGVTRRVTDELLADCEQAAFDIMELTADDYYSALETVRRASPVQYLLVRSFIDRAFARRAGDARNGQRAP